MFGKKIVEYIEVSEVQVGHSAFVVPTNHPSEWVNNNETARTSEVISFHKDTGVFETINTIYKPKLLLG